MAENNDLNQNMHMNPEVVQPKLVRFGNVLGIWKTENKKRVFLTATNCVQYSHTTEKSSDSKIPEQFFASSESILSQGKSHVPL